MPAAATAIDAELRHSHCSPYHRCRASSTEPSAPLSSRLHVGDDWVCRLLNLARMLESIQLPVPPPRLIVVAVNSSLPSTRRCHRSMQHNARFRTRPTAHDLVKCGVFSARSIRAAPPSVWPPAFKCRRR